jgi:hypothetical protein
MYTALKKGPEDPTTLSKADLIRVNVNVPIAAQWIRHAGLVIWNLRLTLAFPSGKMDYGREMQALATLAGSFGRAE